MSTLRKCDKCGKTKSMETSCSWTKVEILEKAYSQIKGVKTNMDLCPECTLKFKQFLNLDTEGVEKAINAAHEAFSIKDIV